jgi:hypothetical protein
MTTLFISGPMTGYPDLNVPAFDRAEEALTKAGYKVVSPAAEARATEGKLTWTEYVTRSIGHLFRVDGVAILAGWAGSRGASVEVAVARGLGLPLLSVREWCWKAAQG